MKNTLLVLATALCLLSLQSCIRDEALNEECDITAVSETWLSTLPDGFLISSPVVRNRTVTFMVSADADITSLAPQFEVTEGATLYFVEESGTAIPFDATVNHDFTLPQTYRVVSQDEAWSKDYEVSFERPRPVDICTFEDFTYNDENQYQRLLWRQTDGSLNANLWDNGNPGFAFTGQGATPLDYPTTFVEDESSMDGRYALLRTLSTGAFGSFVGMPIAAGNLFLGEFQVANAVTNPLKATRFGQPIVKDQPRSIEGWYRYTPGTTMTGGTSDEVDRCDIYAVLYEVTPNAFVPLFGDNVKTSERIVAIAQLPDGSAQPEWTHFEIPFVWQNGKQFDEVRRRNGEYALTIVLTSSYDGAYFRGAVGSTLCVDNLQINWMNE